MSRTPLPIRYLGDPVLRTECDPVTEFDKNLGRLIEDMFAAMYQANGVGLAANQVGVPWRLFVYDCHDDVGGQHVGHVVNPRLVEADGRLDDGDEGCLSLPGLYYPTPRYSRAVVEGVDRTGAPVRIEGTGYFARCLQHESDHLKGMVYTDRLTGLTRRRAMRGIRSATWAS